MNYAKKILALLLVFCVVLNLTSAVFAEGDDNGLPPEETVVEEEPAPEEVEPPDGEAPGDEKPPDETAPEETETAPEETTEQPPEENGETPPDEAAGEETADPDEEANMEETEPTEPTEALPEQPEEAEVPTIGATIQDGIIQIAYDKITDVLNPFGEVIDQPWQIDRPGVVLADTKFGANGILVDRVNYALLKKDGVTKVCYCIEPDKHITDAAVEKGYTANDQLDAWTNLSVFKQRAIHLTLAYGYPTRDFNDISSSTGLSVVSQKYAATQLIIWEIILGVRDPNTFVCSNMFCNAFSQSNNPVLYDVYNKINTDLIRHNYFPSFATRNESRLSQYTYDLNYDKASGKYVCTLVDTTPANYRTLPDYNFVSTISGLTITRVNDYTLRIECTEAAAKNLPTNLKFEAAGKAVEPNKDATIIVWEAKGTTDQKLVSSDCVDDPVPVYFGLKANVRGTMTARKTSPTGDVEGYCFKFYSWADDKAWYAKTDANGNLCQTDSSYSTLGSTQFTELPDGQYSMLEVLSRKGKDLVFPDSWTVTVFDANGKVTSTKTYTSADMTTDANGDCRIQAAMITGLSGGGSITMTINNVPLKAPLEIKKTSPDGKIEGITFHVYDASNTEVGSAKTDKDGIINIEGLVIGQTYTVHEDVPQGYICTENDKKITIQVGTDTNKVSFENKPLVLKLVKQSPDGKKEGITFQIFAGDDNHTSGAVWKTMTTDANGGWEISGIPAGVYWIHEVVPEGYAPQEDQRIEVTTANTENNPAVVTFVNEPLVLKLVKESPDGNNSNISFRIYAGDTNHANGKVWKIVKTDANGTWTITGIPAGVYWIREVVPDGYTKQADQRIEVTTANTEDNPAVVTFVNKPITLKIVKESPDGNNEGITFQIFKSASDRLNGKVWQTVVTGKGGSITLEKLTPGTYWVREIVPEGYASQEDQSVTVTTDNTPENPATVTFVNVPLSAIKVIKTSPDGNVEGITFQLFEGDLGHNKETVFAEGKTDANGEILFTNLDPSSMVSRGVYWVREIVPEGYAPQEDQCIVITAANTPVNPAVVTFDNIPLYGSITVNKVNTADTPLAGATFLLEYSTDDGTTWTAVKPATEEENGIGTCSTVGEDGTLTTGEDGQVKFENLIVLGVTYRLTETVAPAGYQLLAEPVFTGGITANEESSYEIYRTVVNVPLLQMPPTGGDGSVRIIGMVSTLVAAASICALTLLLRKRKENG